MTTPQALEQEIAQGLTYKLVSSLFLPAPKWDIPLAKRNDFERQFAASRNQPLDSDTPYVLPHPKVEFLRYLTTEHNVLLHGTVSPRIAALMPRPQHDANGVSVRGVFATSDAIWPMFFALIDRATFTGSMRNGCFVVDGPIEKRFYFFSVNRGWLARNAWSHGTVYVLPRSGFRRTDVTPVYFDEWVSERAVQPIMKIHVTPWDFPFIDHVAGHDEHESIYESWLAYRRRIGKVE
jgi:hypothetical protein